MQRIEIDWQKHGLEKILKVFLQAGKKHQASIVCWDSQHTDGLYILTSFQAPTPCQISSQLPAGFLLHPFASNQGSLFLPAQLLYHHANNEFELLVQPEHSRSQDFLATVQHYLQTDTHPDYYVTASPGSQDSDSKSEFIQLVEKGLLKIEQSELEKIVLARTKTVNLSDDFDLLAAFVRLQQAYPDYFVSLISTPDHGTWLGCSPELLLSVNGLEIQTVSVAGTKPNAQAWTVKEYQEQALVTQFIRRQLESLQLHDFDESPPCDLVMGQFKHLSTRFRLKLPTLAAVHQLTEQLLTLLHPTPAVCGSTQQAALSFIQRHENLERQLYCGYLGPCHIQSGQIQLHVNIRCMQLLKHQAVLYAGAGITALSESEKEWQETELKCQTLLDFL